MIFYAFTTEEEFERSSQIESLIKRIACGDVDAVGALYELVKTDVFAYALSKTGNKTDAEDVMQETFVNIYKHAKQYQPKGKPMAWIITIELNLIRRHFQLAKRTIGIEEQPFSPFLEESFEQKVINNAFISNMLKILSDEEREIISLHLVSGFKHREIADIIDKPLATVLSKYNRAIKKLQGSLKEVKK